LRSARPSTSHLGVGEVAQLHEHERGALLIGKILQVGHELAQLGPALHLVVKPGCRGLDLGAMLLASRAQHRQAAVASDRVEPRLEGKLPFSTHEVAVGRAERLLHGVLGFLARPEHVAREREDPRDVALVEDLESHRVPAAGAGDEVVVAAQAQQALGAAAEASRPQFERIRSHPLILN